MRAKIKARQEAAKQQQAAQVSSTGPSLRMRLHSLALHLIALGC